MKRNWFVAIAAIAALCAIPAAAYQWTEHIPIMDGLALGGWYSDVKVDSNGVAHFSTASGTFGEIYYIQNDASTVFELVGLSAAENEFTSIGLMPDGSPVMVYYDNRSTDCKYCVRNGPDDWTVTTIPNPSGGDYGDACSMAVGPDGVVHVVWIRYGANYKPPHKIQYARLENNVWTVEDIESNYTGIFPWPDIVVLPNGEPAVCYIHVSNYTGTIIYAERNAGVWTKQTVATDALAVDASGAPGYSYNTVAMTSNDAGDVYIAYPRDIDPGDTHAAVACIAKQEAGTRAWGFEDTRTYSMTPAGVDIALDSRGEPVLAIDRFWFKYYPDEHFGFGFVAKRGGYWVLEQILLENRGPGWAGLCMDIDRNTDEVWAGITSEDPAVPGVECLSINHGALKRVTSPPGWFQPRWDFFAIPEFPAGSADPSDLFGTSMNNRLYEYHPVAKTFLLYPLDFTTLDPGMGYLLFMNVGETYDVAYDAIGLGRAVEIPELGRSLIGCPVIPGAGSLPQGDLEIYNRTLGVARTVAEDAVDPDPWVSPNWIFWDQDYQTAKICNYSGGDSTVVEPWRAYWIWAFHKDLVIYFDDEW
jgi:hypothetical protein